ncbi:unnamed protein product [Cyprideis torosa]|uniref:Uncharacterized protein n=1 Tax=Cyprideis torosa TaxID=163714 RepID=A0A7R8ZKA9_9CRUS|nr:unnamed protein product [Cyprideis torosa]CAG0881363.1 unnamed protein product [Cyprideis torosa]
MPEALFESIPHPTVEWAQRKDRVLMTICLEDVSNPEINIKESELSFKGVGGTEQKLHACNLTFFGQLDPEKSTFTVRPRNIEFTLMKKEAGPFWPRLLKEKGRLPWLKVDFNRWKDEDDEEEEEPANNFDFESIVMLEVKFWLVVEEQEFLCPDERELGPLLFGAICSDPANPIRPDQAWLLIRSDPATEKADPMMSRMGGMGGMGDAPNLDDLNLPEDEDDEDDDLPELEDTEKKEGEAKEDANAK